MQNSVVPPGTWYIDQRERKRIKPVRGEKVVMNFRMHTGDTMKKNASVLFDFYSTITIYYCVSQANDFSPSSGKILQAHKKPPKKTPPKKKVTATKRVIIEAVKRSARI